MTPSSAQGVLPPKSRRREVAVVAGLLLLALMPAVGGIIRLHDLGAPARITDANARFIAAPLPVVLHILAALPFSLLGAFQFAPSFRRRYPRLHRLSGRLLAPLGLVAAISGLWMTFTYPWPTGDGVAVYLLRLLFGGAMLATLLLGLVAVVRRDFAVHGAWMTRAYAIGMGAGTQALTHLPWIVLVGWPGTTGRAVAMGAGWVINLLVAEWVIHAGRGTR